MMMMARLVTRVKICGWPMFTTRIAIASTPITTAGSTGVPKRGLTLASLDPAGRLLSRAIANIILIPAVCTARTQTVTAMTTVHSSTVPRFLPSVCSTTYCRPSLARFSSVRSGVAINAISRISPPMTNDATRARRMARGALRRGSTVSSPSEAAVSNPYITYAEASEATRNAPR